MFVYVLFSPEVVFSLFSFFRDDILLIFPGKYDSAFTLNVKNLFSGENYISFKLTFKLWSAEFFTQHSKRARIILLNLLLLNWRNLGKL